LANNPLLKEIWETGLGKEIGHMVEDDNKTGTKGTNSIFVMSHNKITNILHNRVVTYCRLVVDFCPQKRIPTKHKQQLEETSFNIQVN
jgi:Na+-translocating ferredoxin:NAD+ oxidoreductase RnfC subunit